jgi:non-ribosomal peptide synthetase component F
MTLGSAPAAPLLRDRLDHWARVRPADVAVSFGDRAFTWEQWRQRVLRLTGALRAAGVTAGDRIATFDLSHQLPQNRAYRTDSGTFPPWSSGNYLSVVTTFSSLYRL